MKQECIDLSIKRMTRHGFFAFMIMFFFHLSVFATQTLNLDQFPSEFSIENHPFDSLHNQLVQVRGFWYPISFDQGILSTHSGLKSCCLSAPDNLHQQLMVKGKLVSIPVQRVITLEGIFKIEPLYNQEGKLIQLYVLEQAQEVQQATSYALLLILGFLLALLCIWRFLFKQRQFKRTVIN